MNCHICNKHLGDFIDNKSQVIYYHCLSCEYIFKDPKYYQKISDQKSRYDLHTNNEEDQGYIEYFNRFLKFLTPYINDSISTALDFGCGKSTILAKLISKNYQVNCDYYDPIYHPNLNINKKYDLIVSTEVFEHLHNPKETFKQLSEMLNHKGILAIQTQFHSNTVNEFKNWYYHQDPTHIVFFRPKTFEILANEFGFKLLGDNSKNMIILEKI